MSHEHIEKAINAYAERMASLRTMATEHFAQKEGEEALREAVAHQSIGPTPAHSGD